jgi:hypothetical protein
MPVMVQLLSGTVGALPEERTVPAYLAVNIPFRAEGADVNAFCIGR